MQLESWVRAHAGRDVLIGGKAAEAGQDALWELSVQSSFSNFSSVYILSQCLWVGGAFQEAASINPCGRNSKVHAFTE